MSFADDLDMLGAEGLASQYITLRVKAIDKQKLGKALGGASGAAVPAALAVVDFAPKVALDLAMPMVADKARAEYGVDLDWQVGDAPPKAGEKPPGAGKGLLVGAVLGSGSLWAARRFGLIDIARSAVARIF